jgi:hypothetical protein
MFTFWHVLVVTCCWPRQARFGELDGLVSLDRGQGLRGGQGRAVAGVAGFVEQAGERVDRFEEQCFDAGFLVSGAGGAEFGEHAAVLGLVGEMTDLSGRAAAWSVPGERNDGFLDATVVDEILVCGRGGDECGDSGVVQRTGSSEANRCSRAMAWSANSGSSRPARAR